MFWKAVACQSMLHQKQRLLTVALAVADLFALQSIHQDILLCNEKCALSGKAKAISRMFEQLCSELQGTCGPLVDAVAFQGLVL